MVEKNRPEANIEIFTKNDIITIARVLRPISSNYLVCEQDLFDFQTQSKRYLKESAVLLVDPRRFGERLYSQNEEVKAEAVFEAIKGFILNKQDTYTIKIEHNGNEISYKDFCEIAARSELNVENIAYDDKSIDVQQSSQGTVITPRELTRE